MTSLIKRAQDLLRPLHWRIAGFLPSRGRRQYLYTARMGRPGNFSEPRTFNEKVNWRILNDRRGIIADLCDKDRMKEIARGRVPELKVPRTLWRGRDLADAPDLDGIGRWVLKPNHSSGAVLFGPDPRQDPAAESASWLDSVPHRLLGEWGYGQARAELLLEERLPGDNAPADYKIYVFDGVPRLVQVNSGRGTDAETATFLTPEWRPLPVRWLSIPAGSEPRPANLDRMLDVAARLSGGLDFIRVDLYDIDGELWFGELSPYPGGGMMRFRPQSFVAEMGSWWTLPSLDEVRG